ncbi:hypothetical protein Tco_1564221 [Tanacetum coccineum]
MLWHQNSGAKPLPLNSGAMTFLVPNSILLTLATMIYVKVITMNKRLGKAQVRILIPNVIFAFDHLIYEFTITFSLLFKRWPYSLRINCGNFEDHIVTENTKNSNAIKDKIGNGNITRFWHDKWYGDVCFKEKFHRLFNLELQKDASVALKLQNPNVALSFRRPPRSGDLSVKSAREEIDKHVLVVSSSHMRWSKVLPIKLNVFLWRLMLKPAITFSSVVRYPWICFGCLVVGGTSKSLALLVLFPGRRGSTELDSILLEEPLKGMIFDNIVSHTFFWVNNRCRKFNVNRVAWLNDPLNAIVM